MHGIRRSAEDCSPLGSSAALSCYALVPCATALTFGMSAMARAVEIGLDAERAEVFDDTQHMTARDVAPVLRLRTALG